MHSYNLTPKKELRKGNFRTSFAQLFLLCPFAGEQIGEFLDDKVGHVVFKKKEQNEIGRTAEEDEEGRMNETWGEASCGKGDKPKHNKA